MSESQPLPIFSGLVIYRNPKFRYSLFFPDGWHELEPVEDVGGPVFAPNPENIETSFSVEARDLGVTITAEDLPAVRSGFLAGLRQLPEAKIETREAEAIGNLLTLEARLTFRAGEQIRKRWTRLLYQGTTQVRLIAQGATVAEFDYWLPMFYESMRTFRFGDWWADVIGRDWLPTLDALQEEWAPLAANAPADEESP